MVAPETPISALLTISISELVEKAARTEVMVKAMAPVKSKRRLPIRSPKLPIVISDPARKKP